MVVALARSAVSLEENPIYQWFQTMRGIRAELDAMTGFDRGQVTLLATTTSHSWKSAIEAVKRGDFRAAQLVQAILPGEVASLNLPPPKVPKGRRSTRRQRRKG
jgi:hypothetical protein